MSKRKPLRLPQRGYWVGGVDTISASSLKEAARQAAINILQCQHPDYNDVLIIELVTDQAFSYVTNLVFEAEQLR